METTRLGGSLALPFIAARGAILRIHFGGRRPPQDGALAPTPESG